jgi:transcriptional regulator with XRE-family HTH domain
MKPKIERSPETRARLSEAAKKTWERRRREKKARKRGTTPVIEPKATTEEATSPDVLSFGTEVRRLRLAAEMTLADLAERTRLGIPYLSLLERQKTRTPHELRVRAIAKALDAEPEHLLMLASLGHGAPVSHDRYRVVCEQNVALRKQVETLRAERDAAVERERTAVLALEWHL